MKSHSIRGGNGLKLSVLEFGNLEGKSILFLHGISQCHLSFEKQYSSFLAEKYRIIVPDLRGHGNSGKSEKLREYTNGALWADDIDSIISSLNLKNLTVVAWSYSGYVILDYIKKYGTLKIEKINFVSSAVMLTKKFDMVGNGLLRNVKNMSSKNISEYVDGTINFLNRAFYNKIDNDEMKKMISYNSLTPYFVRKAMFTRVIDFQDILNSLEDISILVSYGEYDEIILPEMSKFIVDNVHCDVKISEYKECGHSIFYENSGRFNRELNEFIGDVFD